MMNSRRWIGVLGFVCVGIMIMTGCGKKERSQIPLEGHPRISSLMKVISTTGTVEPQNRLEIKPAIAGRIEEIFVREGDMVMKGAELGRMSSTDRAALLDAARSKGEEAVKYWADAYKPIPLVAPIDGEVIVRGVESGQTVTTADAVFVMSDRLIVVAHVDETDIGFVKKEQKVLFSIDAYPEVEIEGTVEHIAYESTLMNNVTMYKVDIVITNAPAFLRSGMSATLRIVLEEKHDVLTVPLEMVITEGSDTFLTVKKWGGTEKRKIVTGMSDDIAIEIVSGVTERDTYVQTPKKSGKNKRSAQKTSPLSPMRPRGR